MTDQEKPYPNASPATSNHHKYCSHSESKQEVEHCGGVLNRIPALLKWRMWPPLFDFMGIGIARFRSSALGLRLDFSLWLRYIANVENNN
jgi:hypothetical protein